MKLSIVILNYNSAKRIEACLQKVFEHAPACEFEVIVVDNASKEHFDDVRKKWCDKENITFLLLPKNVGFGQGNERGLMVARGEYLLILNPDVELLPLAVNKMVAFLDAHKNVGLVAPQLLFADGKVQDSYRRFPTPSEIIIKRTGLRHINIFKKKLARSLMWDKNPETTEDVDWVVGACLMLKKAAIKDIGTVFDKRFFLFFEDTDLCRRLWENNWRVVYLPEAKALHHHTRLSEGGLLEIFKKPVLRTHIASGIKYFLKYLGKKNPRP